MPRELFTEKKAETNFHKKFHLPEPEPVTQRTRHKNVMNEPDTAVWDFVDDDMNFSWSLW